MRRAWVMLPEKAVVADMVVILKSLASQLELMPKYAYVKRMRIGQIQRDIDGMDMVKGIEIYVEGGETHD